VAFTDEMGAEGGYERVSRGRSLAVSTTEGHSSEQRWSCIVSPRWNLRPSLLSVAQKQSA